MAPQCYRQGKVKPKVGFSVGCDGCVEGRWETEGVFNGEQSVWNEAAEYNRIQFYSDDIYFYTLNLHPDEFFLRRKHEDQCR